MPRPHLVVVPLSTLPNWEREFAAWAPKLNVVVMHGTQAAREVVWKHEVFAPSTADQRSDRPVCTGCLLAPCCHALPTWMDAAHKSRK